MCLNLINKGNISDLVDLPGREPGRDILLCRSTRLQFESELNCNSMKPHQTRSEGRSNT